MNRIGLSAVIGVVLLVGVSLLIAGVIFAWGSDYITQLSPPVPCDGVSFRAEIIQEPSGFFLSAVNDGVVSLEGFVISAVGTGEEIVVEDVSVLVKPGNTEEKELKSSYSDGTYTITPKIRASDDKVRTCIAVYRIETETSFGAVG